MASDAEQHGIIPYSIRPEGAEKTRCIFHFDDETRRLLQKPHERFEYLVPISTSDYTEHNEIVAFVHHIISEISHHEGIDSVVVRDGPVSVPKSLTFMHPVAVNAAASPAPYQGAVKEAVAKGIENAGYQPFVVNEPRHDSGLTP